MAPTEVDIEWQTNAIIHFLLDDEGTLEPRHLQSADEGQYETDGGDDFDPVLIADKLRTIADSMNDDVKFQAALSGLKQAAAKEAVEAAFSKSVEALCETHASKGTEVAPEMQLIKASVAFGLYVKKSSPELINKVQGAMATFLNRRVGAWVQQQGGWTKVQDIAK
ncbi:uncharacterized protein PAE49_002707 [Odontesthes bonariensis]